MQNNKSCAQKKGRDHAHIHYSSSFVFLFKKNLKKSSVWHTLPHTPPVPIFCNIKAILFSKAKPKKKQKQKQKKKYQKKQTKTNKHIKKNQQKNKNKNAQQTKTEKKLPPFFSFLPSTCPNLFQTDTRGLCISSQAFFLTTFHANLHRYSASTLVLRQIILS